jgi:hypothetical protein
MYPGLVGEPVPTGDRRGPGNLNHIPRGVEAERIVILNRAVVRKFRSIEDSGTVRFEPDVEGLVLLDEPDLVYLEVMSGYLREGGRRGLDPGELAGEGSIVRLSHQQRLLPAIGREPLHRFARLFATLDEL